MRPPQKHLLEPLAESDALQTHLNPLMQRGLRVERLIGIGGTSEVVLARDRDGKAYALKRLLGQFRNDRMRRDAILFEGVHLSLAHSSKVIRCHELLTLPLPTALIQKNIGRDPSALAASARHEIALLLEYIEGVHLRSILKSLTRRAPPLQPEEIASLIYDVSQGIRALHQAKRAQGRACPITHGDLSPTNILLRLDGSAILIDLSSSSSQLNRDCDYLRPGKLNYLSPGQRRGEDEGISGDLYALGVMWFELVTGAIPPRDQQIRRSALRRAGWPSKWARIVSGLLSPSVSQREDAFRILNRSTLWGGDYAHHHERKRIARRSLAVRVSNTRQEQGL